MKTLPIILIILFVIIGGVIVYLYFFYEKPLKDENLNFANLNIFGIDIESDSFIVTGYNVYVNGIYHSDGKTNKVGAALQKILVNSSVVVYNYNLEDQEYYTFSKEFLNVRDDAYRIELGLQSPGELNITHTLEKNLTILLNLESLGYLKDLIFCLRGTGRIVYISSNSTQIERIDGNKCFLGKTLNKGETLVTIIDYEKFGTLGVNDYIEVIFYDINKIPFQEDMYREIETYQINII